MQVFARILQRLRENNILQPGQLFVPTEGLNTSDLTRVHEQEYLDSFLSGTLDEARVRRIGFGPVTNTPVLAQRTLSEVAGTLLTARLALKYRLACNTAGGTHHAFPSYGSGFCILNDLAVTSEVLLREGLVQRVLIIDLDVHQGDGTAFIFQGRSDVFTFSMHCESNFPARKQRSHLDIALPDHTGDQQYLDTLAQVLPDVLQSFRPDLVLYDAGVDVHIDDSLGRLDITDEGLRRRELLTLDTCLGHGVPTACYVGGGYHRDLNVLADRHILLHKAATQMWLDHGLGSQWKQGDHVVNSVATGGPRC